MVVSFRNCFNSLDERLTEEFLQHFNIFDKMFSSLIPANTLRSEFEDWLVVNLRYVRSFKEREFVAHIINQDSDGFCGHFIRYIFYVSTFG